jgi:cell filamentation protein
LGKYSKRKHICNYEYIEVNATRLFEKLKNENHLTGTPQDQVPYRLSHYLGEINVLHPFREGNGRAQRLFIEYLAENAGYSVDFSQVSAQEMIEASAESFACDYTKMDKIFLRITEPVQEITYEQNHV